jgi:DNA repair protein RadC
MNLEILIGAKAAQKIQKSGINILQACDIEIEYIAGRAAAKKIKAAKELINSEDDKTQIRSSNDAYQIVKDMQFLDHERFEVLALNRNNKVMERILISQGGVAATVVDLKILFKRLLICGASGFICVHNHPSGSLQPSQHDIDLTRKINEGAQLIDLRLYDHIIVAGNSFYSFVDNGNL